MYESVLKTSCEIIEFGWSKDRSPIDTFIMGLATSIRERNDYEEEVCCALLLLKTNSCTSLLVRKHRKLHKKAHFILYVGSYTRFLDGKHLFMIKTI